MLINESERSMLQLSGEQALGVSVHQFLSGLSSAIQYTFLTGKFSP